MLTSPHPPLYRLFFHKHLSKFNPAVKHKKVSTIPNSIPFLVTNALHSCIYHQPVCCYLFFTGFFFASNSPSIHLDEEQLHVISTMHTDADIYFWIRCFFGFLLLLLLHSQIPTLSLSSSILVATKRHSELPKLFAFCVI